MAEASIPVDPFNPGQVFACLGFAEAANVLLGEATGFFDWSNREAVQFHLRTPCDEDPVKHTLCFLSNAIVSTEAPYGSENLAGWKRSWGVSPKILPRGGPYASPDPDSPATLVAALSHSDRTIRIDYWADVIRDNTKFWAGAGGYPGSALVRDALNLVREIALTATDDPFSCAVPQSSSFRLDWRRDYIPLDAGFSLNRHAGIETVGYPIVELLGAIGLTNARPRRRTKLEYRYGIVGSSRDEVWLPISLLRAALGAAAMPFDTRQFNMYLSWPGKEGQARAITTVTEHEER